MRRIWKRPACPRVSAAVALMAVLSLALLGAGTAGADATVAVNCAADPTALTTALASPSLTDGTTLGRPPSGR